MRRLTLIIFQSLKAVEAYKLRTVFCLISVALGISSISIIVAATEGTFKKAYDVVAKFGPDAILVVGGGEESRAIEMKTNTITMQDVQAVKDSFPTAYSVLPMTFAMNTPVSFRDKKYQVRLIGATEIFTASWVWHVEKGYDLTQSDVAGYKNVCLLGTHVAQQLFGNEVYPIGKYILIKRIPVLVIGILSSRGTTPAGENLDDRVVMPITTVMKKILNENKYVNFLRIKFYNYKNLSDCEKDVLGFFRKRHNIPDGEPDDVSIVSSKMIIMFLAALTGSLVIFLGIAGIISLVVAGFVLANLFLLSVNERSREIGIRRALGARKIDILTQFIGEAVIITSGGGVAGFALGVIASKFITMIADFPIYFSSKAFFTGLFLSWVVGVLAGLHPAKKAAEINPIEAIRK